MAQLGIYKIQLDSQQGYTHIIRFELGNQEQLYATIIYAIFKQVLRTSSQQLSRDTFDQIVKYSQNLLEYQQEHGIRRSIQKIKNLISQLFQYNAEPSVKVAWLDHYLQKKDYFQAFATFSRYFVAFLAKTPSLTPGKRVADKKEMHSILREIGLSLNVQFIITSEEQAQYFVQFYPKFHNQSFLWVSIFVDANKNYQVNYNRKEAMFDAQEIFDIQGFPFICFQENQNQLFQDFFEEINKIVDQNKKGLVNPQKIGKALEELEKFYGKIHKLQDFKRLLGIMGSDISPSNQLIEKQQTNEQQANGYQILPNPNIQYIQLGKPNQDPQQFNPPNANIQYNQIGKQYEALQQFNPPNANIQYNQIHKPQEAPQQVNPQNVYNKPPSPSESGFYPPKPKEQDVQHPFKPNLASLPINQEAPIQNYQPIPVAPLQRPNSLPMDQFKPNQGSLQQIPGLTGQNISLQPVQDLNLQRQAIPGLASVPFNLINNPNQQARLPIPQAQPDQNQGPYQLPKQQIPQAPANFYDPFKVPNQQPKPQIPSTGPSTVDLEYDNPQPQHKGGLPANYPLPTAQPIAENFVPPVQPLQPHQYQYDECPQLHCINCLINEIPTEPNGRVNMGLFQQKEFKCMHGAIISKQNIIGKYIQLYNQFMENRKLGDQHGQQAFQNAPNQAQQVPNNLPHAQAQQRQNSQPCAVCKQYIDLDSFGILENEPCQVCTFCRISLLKNSSIKYCPQCMVQYDQESLDILQLLQNDQVLEHPLNQNQCRLCNSPNQIVNLHNDKCNVCVICRVKTRAINLNCPSCLSPYSQDDLNIVRRFQPIKND